MTTKKYIGISEVRELLLGTQMAYMAYLEAEADLNADNFGEDKEEQLHLLRENELSCSMDYYDTAAKFLDSLDDHNLFLIDGQVWSIERTVPMNLPRDTFMVRNYYDSQPRFVRVCEVQQVVRE